jgi:hypothetical protein
METKIVLPVLLILAILLYFYTKKSGPKKLTTTKFLGNFVMSMNDYARLNIIKGKYNLKDEDIFFDIEYDEQGIINITLSPVQKKILDWWTNNKNNLQIEKYTNSRTPKDRKLYENFDWISDDELIGNIRRGNDSKYINPMDTVPVEIRGKFVRILNPNTQTDFTFAFYAPEEELIE